MLEPPSVAEPFASESERADEIVQLIEVDERLQSWLQLHREHPTELPPEVRERLVDQPRAAGDTPELRLSHWVTIFGDDLETVHDTRSRVVHGVHTPDGEIRGARWLGRRILSLLEGTAA